MGGVELRVDACVTSRGIKIVEKKGAAVGDDGGKEEVDKGGLNWLFIHWSDMEAGTAWPQSYQQPSLFGEHRHPN